MPTDYQRQKNNPFVLPESLYKRILAVIRDYNRQCGEIINILYDTPEKDCEIQAKNNNAKPTEGRALKLAVNRSDVDAVRSALCKIPEEYQEGIFNNIVYRKPFEKNASYRTWIRWKQKFVYEVGKNLNLVM